MSVKLESDTIKSVLNLSKKFYECYEREKEKLPYRLNLIDEVRPNETAHSRILGKFLKYKPSNEYVVLQGFIDFIKENHKEDFEFNHSLDNCQIEVEKKHIDVFISSEQFAVIIENKIHGAIDQEKQIERYIKTTKGQNFDENNIYVIYLTRDGGEPSTESFSEADREAFKTRKRYVELSYRYDIIAWLEKFSIKENEPFMSSALHQYIDHLKKLFNLRNIDNNMNKELLQTIQNELGLNEDYQANIAKIDLALDNLSKMKGYLDNTLPLNWLHFYHEKMKKDYPNNRVEPYIEGDHPIVSIVLQDNDVAFSVSIEYSYAEWDKKNEVPYFGIRTYPYVLDSQNAELQKLLNGLLSGYKGSRGWYCYKHAKSFQKAYEEFQELFKMVLAKIPQNQKGT